METFIIYYMACFLGCMNPVIGEVTVNMVLKTSNTVVHEGDTVEIECSIRSYSPANVTWKKDGNPICQDYISTSFQFDQANSQGPIPPSEMHQTTKYRMVIWSVKRIHSGVYTCQGYVGMETGENQIHMNVLPRRNLVGISDVGSRMPYINMVTETWIGLESSPAQLLCRGESGTAVETQWYILDVQDDTRQILIDANTKDHLLLSNGDLMVLNSVERVEGVAQYACQVSNQYGNDRQQITHICFKE